MIAGAAGVVAVAIGVAFLLADGDEDAVERSAPRAGAPNLLVVMVDDQPLGSFTDGVMPATREYFAEEGTVFDQAIAAPPLCCPSRAGFLTGRYAHNHGVLANDPGYETMTGKEATFPVALQAGGYRTGMIGKFLNGYERVAGKEPAPGFDRWYAITGYADYFNFQVSDDGEARRVDSYATDDLTREAIDFTGAAHRDGVPFFLWLSYNAPHTVLPGYPPPCNGLAAQPRDAEAFAPFADAPLPQPGSFDAGDLADRPSLADGAGTLRPRKVEQATRAWRCGLAAMAAVDEGVERLLAELRESGELDDTVVVYLSDNGYFYGEHRLVDDKRLPLEPALRIPLAISAAGVRGGVPPELSDLVSQVDLAPTLLDYAGVTPCPDGLDCEPMDGRSLRGLLEGEATRWPEDRAIPLELDDGWSYRALRTTLELYMELAASRKTDFPEPAIELYDLAMDPDQLTNLADDPAERERRAELHARLEVLGRCSGIEGRDPKGERPYCE